MTIETTPTEYVIRLDRSAFTAHEIEPMTRILRLYELARRLEDTREDADQLANELTKNWWSTHKGEQPRSSPSSEDSQSNKTDV